MGRSQGQQLATFDALELATLCGVKRPVTAADVSSVPDMGHDHDRDRYHGNVVWVDPDIGDDAADGSAAHPVATVHQALASAAAPRTVVLKPGIHFLGPNGTLQLGADDAGTTFTSAPGGGPAWLSGGTKISGLKWARAGGKHHGSGAWVADVSHLTEQLRGVRGLFTVAGERLIRARWPNANPEQACWGYSCSDKDIWSLNSDMVSEWHKPAAGGTPSMQFADFSTLPNPAGKVKANSQMAEYNTWGEGEGGVCDSVWEGKSYWCCNTSAGGWAEVDAACASAGELGLPVGMTINMSADGRGHALQRVQKWVNVSGAVVAAWHSQTWFLNFFTVSAAGSNPAAGMLRFAKGGSQGGRNWCRCDQCAYAAGLWAGHQWCDTKNRDSRLIGGSWMVENVFEELDAPGEYFFNESAGLLFVVPNATSADGRHPGSAPPAAELIVPTLRTLIRINGTAVSPVERVTIDGVNFRDAMSVYEEQWGVPSGGDWAFHRSAAIELENANNCRITGGLFRRLDGNAVLCTGRTRNVTIDRNEFVLIGQNVLAGWGDTDEWDGRRGDQPRGTVVADNLIHELGFFEKQSSAWFQAKTALTTIRNNICFNMPRAAINFNDGFGGGNVVVDNLIFNTCRESGDHGPINTWDRQVYATDLGPAGATLLDPLATTIARNLIFANYGAAQGVDNDDGSSNYDIHDNIFFDADGFKMDYGGHGSSFTSNVVVTKPGAGDCLGLGPFLKGLGDTYANNTCALIGQSGLASVGGVSQCDPKFMTMHDNIYFTPSGNASLGCGGHAVPVSSLARTHGIEQRSRSAKLPSDGDLVALARAKLQHW